MRKKTLIGLTAAGTAGGGTPATFTGLNGQPATPTFTVLGTPSKAAGPAKPQVTAKPAGAPQTGDGPPG
ncbi:hypothetical protein QRX60_02105 [Amycolatopsis mongoliensis]|uniref:Uncharacterized protein n=1 Tax=Amycolatopsis mongoliensis TaxID=715475 RepID=A0A9Y2JS67_9PSEU|nr:hypothetical protein [Amycolatopsis sp. 4-36]WIY02691.1 hypothetical protein QRX60_02105 [Amycolatopsis sp. 4-36]